MWTSKRAYNTHTQSKSWYFVVSILAIVFSKSKDDACLFSQLLVRSKQILLYCILLCCVVILLCFVLFWFVPNENSFENHLWFSYYWMFFGSPLMQFGICRMALSFEKITKWKRFSQDEIAISTFIENGNLTEQ